MSAAPWWKGLDWNSLSNEQFVGVTEAIDDPRAALEFIVLHEDAFGFDPYYREARVALLKMAARLSEEPK